MQTVPCRAGRAGERAQIKGNRYAAIDGVTGPGDMAEQWQEEGVGVGMGSVGGCSSRWTVALHRRGDSYGGSLDRECTDNIFILLPLVTVEWSGAVSYYGAGRGVSGSLDP